jgi:MATE family multidrug resistance protein
MLGQLGQISVNVADNLMVGVLGKIPLAGISLALSLYIVFFISILGIGMALQPLVSEADGAGDSATVSRSFKHSLLINLLAAIFSIVLVEWSLPFIHLLGQDPTVVQEAIPYLRINMYSLIPFMVFYSFRGLSEGLSETRPPVIAMLIGNVVNICANYVLIFGHFGAPVMGLEGAAIGTFIARTVMTFSLILILWKWNKVTSLGTRIWDHVKAMRLDSYSWKVVKSLMAIGLPTSFQMLFEIGAFAGAALMMGVIGPDEQAAHQVTINVVSATFMICMGLSTAATIRVGKSLGQADYLSMKKSGRSAIYQAVLFMGVTGLLFMLLRFWIPTLYISDESVIGISAVLLSVAALFQLSDGIQVVAIGALRGMQDIKVPTLITFISYLCIALPFSYLAAFKYDMGYIGVWLGLLIGLTVSAILNTWRFNHQISKYLSRGRSETE